MPRALQQGMLGIGQATLAPSLTALGPNRYLRDRDFFTMLGVALLMHVVTITILGLMPRDEVTDIPVRALTFKIGGQDRIAAFGAPLGIGVTVAAPASSAAPSPSVNTTWRANPTQPTITPLPLKPVPIVAPRLPRPVPKVPPTQRQVPQENRTAPLPPLSAAQAVDTLPPPAPLVAAADTRSALPSTDILTQVAIAPEPQRFVREVGAAPIAGNAGAQPNRGRGIADGAVGGDGLDNVMTATTAQTIRDRYEQQISSWIERHKIYPSLAAGAQGRAIVRMRIDRTGYVRYYAIEQSSGNAALDAAAIDMIRRANPVPAVPANYPSSTLIEFLIPIMFRAPQ